jgi:biotin-dependent carboxylase-like uncharacterized protein
LHNWPGVSTIEVSFGGLTLQAQTDTYIAVTGADMPLTINDRDCDLWTSHMVRSGDRIALGYASQGCHSYLAVAGGLLITPSFGSTATVMREHIGGLHGTKLAQGDVLPCADTHSQERLTLPLDERPLYSDEAVLRIVPGYQYSAFTRLKKSLFFSSDYELTDRSDRMGMRLEGPDVASDISQMLSEGICQGAVQVPADGQPIVLLNDRQTIGGYPKLGAVMALDCARLAQLRPGDRVRFKAVSIHESHNINSIAALAFTRHLPQPVS